MTDSIINTKEPVAGLSAASSCISLNIDFDGAPPPCFRPVFTHQENVLTEVTILSLSSSSLVLTRIFQCFDNEFIPGWRPLVSAEESSIQIYKSWNPDSNDKLHTSYTKLQCINQDVNKGDDTRLSVHISLSPSCEKTCQVKIQTVSDEPLSTKDEGDSEPATKKQKKHVSFAGVPEEDNKLQPQQKDIKDIVQKISSAVPPIQSVVVNDISREDLIPAAAVEGKSDTINENNGVYLKAPLGKVLLNYSRQIKKKSDNDEGAKYQKFILTMADGSDPSVATYQNKVQSLAKWFIEAGDDVDLSDETNGLWKVMYLFEQHKDKEDSSNKLSLVGYITLLHVNSPFRKPNPGIIVRVCQALILPPYHKAGHGTQMLNSVYDYAARNNKESSSENICEINVEDPAPAFVRLRDCVDYQRFVSLIAKTDEMPDCSYLNSVVTDKCYFDPVSDEHLLPVAEYLKIRKRQCQKIHDIHKLSEIKIWKDRLDCTLVNDIDGSKKAQYIEEVETNFRLMVKKSLKQLRIEELSAAGGKDEQKALLGKWFDETLSHYRRVLKANDILGKRR